MSDEKYDIVAVGDITTDAFIEVNDVDIIAEKDGRPKEIAFRFGDKIEYEEVVVVEGVGNSPNAAVSTTRLGLRTGLVTYVGNDRNGEDCIAALDKNGVNTALVVKEEGKVTNYHYVLSHKAERTILVNHEKYSYAFPMDLKTDWLYLSSLAENSLDYHGEIVDYLKANPETKLAFQPGTFQMKLGKDTLSEVYAHTEIFFCNKEEAQRILGSDSDDIKELMSMMHALGPKIAVITDGPEGAYAFDGNTAWHMPMYPDIAPPKERTGAGDSFSSAFTAAIAAGHDIPTALSWGPINSMNVVQHIGAQAGLLTQEELEGYLASRPEDYVATVI